MKIRAATTQDHEVLLDLWLRSVRATHHFLSEAEIQALYPLVRDHALPALELWVLEDNATPIGFLGLSGSKVEAMFLDPGSLRRGGGRVLLEHARALKGPLTVDVNEQNPNAVAFYHACGFEIVGRSALDSGGRPYPLLHLRDAWEVPVPGSSQ